MSSKSLAYKLLVLLTAALVFNQLACSKASFDADKENKAQATPEQVETFADDGDDGFSDPTTTTGTPNPTYPTTPTYDTPTYPPQDPSCEILSNTGKCYRNRYNGNEGYTRYPMYNTSGARVRLNNVEIVDGHLNIQVFVDNVRVNFDASNDLIRPARSGRDIRIEFCTY